MFLIACIPLYAIRAKVASLYSLKKDLSEITRRITSTPSLMKIALKTKDDHLFLERWVMHHSNIVGRHNIMIFDNESTDPRVARFYRDNDDILVISFSGFHNNLHMPKLFPHLYSAIWQSCRTYTFLDSDEYLILVENERYISNERIVSRLLEDSDIPSTLVYGSTTPIFAKISSLAARHLVILARASNGESP